MKGTGGNRFIPPDSTRVELMRAIAAGLDDLEDWFDGTDREWDIGAVTIKTTRIRNGKISVSVAADARNRS